MADQVNGDGDSDEQQQPQQQQPTRYSKLATIVVGQPEQEQTFHIHQDVICRHSHLVRAACTVEQQGDTDTPTVRLPNTNPAFFQHYVDHAYGGQGFDIIRTLEQDIEAIVGRPETRSARESQALVVIDRLISLWEIGEQTQDAYFKNAILDELLRSTLTHRRLILPVAIGRIFDLAAPGSGLRRWAVDHFIAFASPDAMRTMSGFLAADVLVECAGAVGSDAVSSPRGGGAAFGVGVVLS